MDNKLTVIVPVTRAIRNCTEARGPDEGKPYQVVEMRESFPRVLVPVVSL